MGMSEKCYLLAGKHAFFHCFCDSGFRTKWTGLWCGSKKFLEYFAFKINGEWLSPENCSSFDEDGATAVHSFSLKKLKVEERLFVPEDLPALVCELNLQNKTKEEMAVEISLEAAVDMRTIEENLSNREYSKKFEENKFFVSSDTGMVAFGSSIKGKEISEGYYKEHYPSGEKQRCFIPGIYSVNLLLAPMSTQTVQFMFVCGKNENELKSSFNQLLATDEALAKKYEVYKAYEGMIENKDVERLFGSAVINLEKCGQDGIFFAGYPWYTQVWGRDICWMVRAAVDVGRFSFAKNSLELLSHNQSEEGIIPNVIYPNGKVDYRSADATPLWLIALNKYIECSGDTGFLKAVEENIVKALNWYRKNADERGFVKNGSHETWMDTLDRKGICLDVCSMWYEALKSGSNLLKLLGDAENSKDILALSKKLKKNVEKFFWKDGFYVDNLESGERSINAVFPLVFGISRKPVRVLDVLESEEFTTSYGVRSLSSHSPNYNPAGYHTGSSWGITTSLVACAEFLNNRIEKGLQYLKAVESMLDKFCVNSLPEAWNSETGELKLLKPAGYEDAAFLQGWSAAGAIICVDEFMIGMKPDALNKSIYLYPAIKDVVRRKRRVGKDFVELTIAREDGRIKFGYKSSLDIRYKLILVPRAIL